MTVYQIIQQKEEQVERLTREISALRAAARMWRKPEHGVGTGDGGQRSKSRRNRERTENTEAISMICRGLPKASRGRYA